MRDVPPGGHRLLSAGSSEARERSTRRSAASHLPAMQSLRSLTKDFAPSAGVVLPSATAAALSVTLEVYSN